MTCGGKAIASPSVLKAVSAVHRIGKKIRSATTQAMIVQVHFLCVETARAIFPSPSGVQVLADDADKEDGDDIGDDHGDDAARRAAADVEIEQGGVIDEIGDVGRRAARAAIGGGQD